MIGRNLMYPLYQGRDFAGWARVDKIGGFLHPERRPAWLLQPLEIDLDDSTWRPGAGPHPGAASMEVPR